MPPITVIAATPQLAEKADDLVLTNVEIGKDGEVSAEVANTSKQTVGDVEHRSFIRGVGKMNFTPAKMIPEEQCM